MDLPLPEQAGTGESGGKMSPCGGGVKVVVAKCLGVCFQSDGDVLLFCEGGADDPQHVPVHPLSPGRHALHAAVLAVSRMEPGRSDPSQSYCRYRTTLPNNCTSSERHLKGRAHIL